MRTYALDDDGFVFDLGPRRLRRRRRGLGTALGAVVMLAIGLVILAANTPDARRGAGVDAAPVVAPPPVWVDIVHPIRLFDLTAPELAKAPMLYAARRNRLGGGRQDILTFGALDGPIYVRLVLYRVGAEPVPAMPLFVDLARAAAAADLSIGRSLTPAPMPTRFGAARSRRRHAGQRGGCRHPLPRLSRRSAGDQIPDFGLCLRRKGPVAVAAGARLPHRSPGFDRGGRRSRSGRLFCRERIAAQPGLCRHRARSDRGPCQLARPE